MSDSIVRPSRMLTASAVLLIISSIFSLIGGLASFNMAAMLVGGASANRGRGTEAAGIWSGLGILSLFGFPFGLTSAIQSLRRRQFGLCLAGALILLVFAAPSFVVLLSVVPTVLLEIFAMLFIILTILGLVIIAFCKKEFM